MIKTILLTVLNIYFGGAIIFGALFVLKPTFFMTKEVHKFLKVKIQRLCDNGPLRYAFCMLVFTASMAAYWPYLAYALVIDGRANNINDMDDWKDQ